MSRYLLAIETSCDETAAAVIEFTAADPIPKVLSNVVASQTPLHERFGGVVPEIASRAHVERIVPVIDEALRQGPVELKDIAAVAVVTTPGLAGSLVIGLTAAKSLAMALGCPLIAVNHLEAHIYACQLAAGQTIFPCVGLVVSGGHTSLFECRSAADFRLLGSTTDDAAGEAFDKVAHLLGLGYPGGPAIEKAAYGGNPNAYRFPRSFIDEDRLDFSFSGLKTAVLYTVRGQDAQRSAGGYAEAHGSQPVGLPDRRGLAPLTPPQLADVAASFQEAVVDVLVAKSRQALQRTGLSTLAVGGGVAANQRFRQRLGELAEEMRVRLFIPPLSLCTDNAAMAAIAVERLRTGRIDPLDIDVTPGLQRR